MKKQVLFIFPLLISLGLFGCTESGSDSSTTPSVQLPSTAEEKIVNSVRGVNHRAHIEQSVKVLYPATMTGAVGLGIDNVRDLAYSYDDGERAYAASGTSIHYNIDIKTEEPIEGTEQEYVETASRIFEEEGTGLSLMETLGPDNKVTTAYASSFDDSTGIYSPLIFATNFANPWDYIEASDLLLGDDGNFHLDTDKAEFLLEAYGLTSTNMVEDAVVKTDYQDNLASIEFVLPTYDTSTYSRESSVKIEYSDFGDATEIAHLKPFTNDNPDLEVALSCLSDATSFTYRKQYRDSFSELEPSDTTGYFTKDAIFFHQRAEKFPNSFYVSGDDYDYLSKRNPADNKYYGFQYEILSEAFTPAMLSETQQLVKDTFLDNGPSFYKLSAALFKKTGDLTYEAEPSIVSTIGQYFDNGFDGVHSDILNGSTLSCKVTLTTDKKAIEKVEVGADMGVGDTIITFTLSNINSTTIPEFALSAISAASFN